MVNQPPEGCIVLEPGLALETAIEFIVYGSDCRGNFYPKLHFFASRPDVVFAQYRATFPKVCHINMDMALPITEANK